MTSTKVLRAELGMYPLETNRDVRKLKWQHKVRSMPRKRLPAILVADRAVWEKITKGRAEIRWDGVDEKLWEGILRGGNQEETLFIEKFGGYKKISKIKDK